jgi:penicillin-insensitive murein endopeptidase
MPDGPLWRVVEPRNSWGAPEAIASIEHAVEAVHLRFPNAPPLYVGQLSAEHGGFLRPHRSHQSGRDADLGYFYRDGAGWYSRATPQNLDREKTWALVEALAADPNVEAIFMDRSVQLMLREWALVHGEPRARLDDELFEGLHRGAPRLVRHEWGHLTHLHVRFRCADSVDGGARALPALVAAGRVSPWLLPAKLRNQPSKRSTAEVTARSSGAVPGSKRPTT